MRFLFYVFAVITVITTSCNDEKKEKELNDRISQLEKELDDCKNGPEKLFGIIKDSFTNGNYTKASETYTLLINKYPGSTYQTEARDYFLKSNEKIKIQQAEDLKKQKAEEELKRASLTKLKKEHDDVSGVTWYEQKYFKHYTNSNRTSIQLGHEKGSTPWMVLFMSYTGDDWIFFEKAYLSYDGNTKEIYFDKYKNKESDNDGGDVWEWIKVQLNDDEIEWFKNFAKSPNAKMRLTGKYEKTRILTNQERQGITDIISGYEYLKENNN